MATVINVDKHGDSWRYRFEGARVNGKRTQFSKSGFATKKEAMEAGQKAASAYETSGHTINLFTASFSDLLNEWLETYCRTNYKYRTYSGYKNSVSAYVGKHLGKHAVQKITTKLLQDYINTMFDKGYSRATLRNIATVIKSCFRYAVEDMHYLANNPATNLRVPSKRVCAEHGQDNIRPSNYIPPDRIEQIFAMFPEGTQAHLPFMLAYKCGLRVGEVYGLVWDDIDFENSTLTVNRQMHYSSLRSEWYISTPKYDSVRTISVDSGTMALLRRTKLRQNQDRLKRGKYYVKNYVSKENIVNVDGDGEVMNFINVRSTGYYSTESTIRYAGYKIRDELNYPEFTFHSLRHTHGTMLAESGMPVKLIMARLGHKTVDVTVKHYMTVTEKLVESGREMIEQLYKNGV